VIEGDDDEVLRELHAEAVQIVSDHALHRSAAARGALDDVTAAILALMPRWTPAVVERLGVAPGAIEELVRGRHAVQYGRGDDVHYIPGDSWRSTMLGVVVEPGVRDAVLAMLRSSVLDAARLPPILKRWRTLARGGTADHAAARLRDEVERRAVRVDPAEGVDQLEDRADKLLAWVDAARTLNLLYEALSDDTLHVAIDRAERSAGLLRRRARDQACLASYQVRHEQDAELARVLDDPEHWCLHFIGVGGTGKTMFVRHLVAHLAPRHGVAIARIDFDHLSPDYPFKDPSRLYEALAAELCGWASEDAERALHSMRGLFSKLRDELRGRVKIDPVAHPLFVEASVIFRDFLRRIAGGRPLVFVLDTCEELARFRIDDRPSPALAKTFEIIELLRYGRSLSSAERRRGGAPPPIFPELHVVLAGRRILAAHGMNYEARSPQPPRGYVRLYEVRGFTRDEATSYLRTARVPPAYDEAILGASPEVADALPIRWSEPRPGSQVPRYHPYDLGVLASLATADDAPSVEEIASAVDEHYVDIRIVRRLSCKPLERVLPIIARLGHVDRSLIRTFVDADELDEVLGRLDEQEWAISEPWGEVPAWSVDPRLLPRLERYCENRPLSRADLQAVTARLDAWFAEGDVARFDWQLLDAGLRLHALASAKAAGDPDAALAALWRWWLPIEQRLFDRRGVEWTADVLEKLLTRGLPSRTDRSEARAARTVVIASLVCALPRTEQTTLGELTEELSGLVAQRSVAPLRIRACAARPSMDSLDAATAGPTEPLDVTTRYAILATVVQEHLSGLPTPAWRALLELSGSDSDRIASSDDRLDLEVLRTYVAAGLAAADDDAASSERDLLALRSVPTGARPRPHAVFSGVDLERRLRVAIAIWFRDWGGDLAGWRATARTLRVRDDLLPMASHIDLELGPVDDQRLAEIASVHERLRAAHRERGTAQTANQTMVQTANQTARTARMAERRNRPWVWGNTIVLAEALALSGQVTRASELLEEVQQLGGSAGLESARMHAWLIRAFRLWDAGVKPAQQLRESANVDDVALVALIDGLSGAHGTIPPKPVDDAMLHAIWRSLPALTRDERAVMIAWWDGPGEGKPARYGMTGAHRSLAYALDAVEHGVLANRPRACTIDLPALPAEAAVEWVAIAARGLALQVIPATAARAWLARAAARMGARRVAEIILVEGEALALRLPRHAIALFELAESCFASARDAIGRVRAGVARVLLGRDRQVAVEVVAATASWRGERVPTKGGADAPTPRPAVPRDALLVPLMLRVQMIEEVAGDDLAGLREALDRPHFASATRAIEIRTATEWMNERARAGANSGAKRQRGAKAPGAGGEGGGAKGQGKSDKGGANGDRRDIEGGSSPDRSSPLADMEPDAIRTPTLQITRQESYGFRDVLGLTVQLAWSPAGEPARPLPPIRVEIEDSYQQLFAHEPAPSPEVPRDVAIEIVVPEHLHSPCWEALFRERRVRRVPEHPSPASTGSVALDHVIVAHESVLPWLLGRATSQDKLSLERSDILEALERNDWNITAAARQLDVTRQQLHSRMQRLELRRSDGNDPPRARPAVEPLLVTSDPRKARDARLCQLVGTVVEDGRTHSAATLVFDDLGLRSKTPSFVGASTLRRQLPLTPLFLLQGLPYREGVPRRDAALRLKAATTRRFAGDLAESGAAVLVVPPLGRSESVAVVTSAIAASSVIDALLAAQTARDLEQVAAAIAEQIRSFADEETALDVCLYAARDWRPPPGSP
jgi:hypothetical protein